MQRSARFSSISKKFLWFSTKSSQSVSAAAAALRFWPSRVAISPKISPALMILRTTSLPSLDSELISLAWRPFLENFATSWVPFDSGVTDQFVDFAGA